MIEFLNGLAAAAEPAAEWLAISAFVALLVISRRAATRTTPRSLS